MDLDFKERYKIEPTFLSFMGIISAVKQLWNEFKSDTLREDSKYAKSLFMYQNLETFRIPVSTNSPKASHY